MTQQFEGKSLEEALDAAAAALGVEPGRVKHRVLLEKRGFLGGMKRVVIEAEPGAGSLEPAAPVTAPAARESAPPAPRRAAPSADRPARGGRGRRGGGGEGRGNRAARGGSRGRGRDRGSDDLRPGDFSQFAEEVPEQGERSAGASIVADWCEEILDIARFDVSMRTDESEERVTVRLYGNDVGRFLDRNGELLDAMQVLANKALGGRKVEKNIEFDCADFKHRREEDLERRARELAELVRAEGGEQLFPAMSPIERRIVHLALQDDADVTTESRGEGFFKRVAVIRRSAATTARP